MNVTEYITSGILELYILGGLSSAEADEVERIAKKYPEIQNALDQLEGDMESISKSYSKEISPEIESSLRATLHFAESKGKSSFSLLLYRASMAASLVFAIVTTSLSIYFWNRWQQAENALISLHSEKKILSENFNLTKQKLEVSDTFFRILKDSSSQLITLKGSALSPNASAKVVWNKQSQEYLLSGVNLLENPKAGKQYQLWAIVDGKPIDAGVFEPTEKGMLKTLNSVGKVEAFAVTIEIKGGSNTPNLEALVLFGKV